jgi:hypothetical protein
MGKVFTFAKFLDMIVRYAKVSYGNFDLEQTNSPNLILAEMLCLLLERMELSKGFMNIEKKTSRPHTSKLTLLPTKAIV